MASMTAEVYLSAQAEEIAKIMHELAQWSKSHPNSRRYTKNLIKLPPVFLSNSEKHGNGLDNLVAMIKTIGEYEDGDANGCQPRLADLPALYNKHGGSPELSEKDLRKIHNWVQQVGFGIRAAIMEQEERSPLFDDWRKLSVPERVYRRLYAHNDKRAFVTCSPRNKNEYKPLRYADRDVKLSWIEQEYEQKKTKRMSAKYGAKPTAQEWKDYGLSGQPIRQMRRQIEEKVSELLCMAQKHDNNGEYEQADAITSRINKMNADLATMKRG